MKAAIAPRAFLPWPAAGAAHCDGVDAGAAGKSGSAGDVQVYQHHFPSMRQQTNIKYHFGQNIKKQSKGIFLQLDELEKAKQSVPSMEINLLEYDDAQNTLTLSVSAQNSRHYRICEPGQLRILILPYSLFQGRLIPP
jgi:hypothetical protein